MAGKTEVGEFVVAFIGKNETLILVSKGLEAEPEEWELTADEAKQLGLVPGATDVKLNTHASLL